MQIRPVLFAANPESGAVFCLLECQEGIYSGGHGGGAEEGKDLDIALLEIHCIGRAHGIIKLQMVPPTIAVKDVDKALPSEDTGEEGSSFVVGSWEGRQKRRR